MSAQLATRPASQNISQTLNPVDQAILLLTEKLTAYSIPALRISLGLVFLVFGALKFVPGASPAEDLAIATVEKLTFGLVPGAAALLLTAVMEVTIGLTLVTGRYLKVGLVVLALALPGIMAPLVLFPELYTHGVTLTAQYVFKDIVLAAAAMVIAAHTLGARLRVAG
jgi:putative oxidoreductase